MIGSKTGAPTRVWWVERYLSAVGRVTKGLKLIGLLIAARPFAARLAVASSALAVVMFLATLSFMATTPGVCGASAGGFPSLSVVPGQLLLTNSVLPGAALWSLGEGWGRPTNGSHE